jgi:hypothetical protein
MKLALIIAIYKRHDLERIVLDNFNRQSEKFGFEIIIAGSEGEVSKELAKGCHYIEVENNPLSDKHNVMLQVAKNLNVDGVVLMGSDDLVSDSFWSNIYKFTPNETNVKGLIDLYFYSTKTQELGHFKGYKNKTQSAGAGRFFSKYILDSMDWKLWDSGLNSGLDTNCRQLLKAKGFEDSIYSMKEAKCVLIDVKNGLSITNEAILNLCEKVDTKKIFSKINKQTIDKIKELQHFEPEKMLLDFNKEYQIESTGVSKYLGVKGTIKTMLGESASIIINKGFGKLCQF